MVSFKLSPADHPTQIESVHVPFSDLKNIVALLSTEVPKIEAVHRNWITQQTGHLVETPAGTAPVQAGGRDTLGQKIGSV